MELALWLLNTNTEGSQGLDATMCTRNSQWKPRERIFLVTYSDFTTSITRVI